MTEFSCGNVFSSSWFHNSSPSVQLWNRPAEHGAKRWSESLCTLLFGKKETVKIYSSDELRPFRGMALYTRSLFELENADFSTFESSWFEWFNTLSCKLHETILLIGI